MIDSKVEKFFAQMERLVIAVEGLQSNYATLVVSLDNADADKAVVTLKQDETVDDPFDAGTPEEVKPDEEVVDDPFDAGTLEEVKPEMNEYETLLYKHGLPYLKEICTKRGLEFLPAARSNTILDLLKASDVKKEAPTKEETVEDPFATGTPEEVDPFAPDTALAEAAAVEDIEADKKMAEAKAEVEDPFADTTSKDEVKNVTLEQVRENLMVLHKLVEDKVKGTGNAAVVAVVKKTGVRLLKDMDPTKYDFAFAETNKAIAGAK